MKIGRIVTLALLPTALFACIYEDEPPRRLDHSRPAYEGEPYGSSAPDGQPSEPPPTGGVGGGPGTPAPASPAPMLVEIDTNETMTATPGDGVGVFVEYASGGKWNVWWTCDTAKTNQSCDFSISITAQSGNVSNVDAQRLGGGYMTMPNPSRVEAKIVTSSEVHGLTFTTKPGAVITLEASVGGLKDGSFLFFVQDGKVRGGYEGRLTNPLQLQGSTP